MIRRTARLRREYLYRKSLEARAPRRGCAAPRSGCAAPRRTPRIAALTRLHAAARRARSAPRTRRSAPCARRSKARAAVSALRSTAETLSRHGACAPRRAARRRSPATRPRADGKPIPTELKGEEAALREQASLEDVRTAALTTHVDDEYARAGEEDPRILLTTSRNPSTRLTAFAKELKLVFPNTTRLNRGAQVMGELVESCRTGGYSDIVIVHEHRGEPDGLVVCHLPFGALPVHLLCHCSAHASRALQGRRRTSG
jgi:hypothetical protein